MPELDCDVCFFSLCVCVCVLSGLLSELAAGARYDKSLQLQTDRCSPSDSDLSIEHGCESRAVSCDLNPLLPEPGKCFVYGNNENELIGVTQLND